MRNAIAYEKIDRIVDRVIDNPRVAARLKEALHSETLIELPSRPGSDRTRATDDETVGDPWDNVPV